MEKDNILLPKGCCFVRLPRISDDRGSLAFGEGLKHIPFEIKRVFWTYDVQPTAERGDHAHRTCQMVLFPIGGSYRIVLDDGYSKVPILMDNPSIGVLIPPLVWCSLSDFSERAACICLASHPYEAEDYIHDYQEFQYLVKK